MKSGNKKIKTINPIWIKSLQLGETIDEIARKHNFSNVQVKNWLADHLLVNVANNYFYENSRSEEKDTPQEKDTPALKRKTQLTVSEAQKIKSIKKSIRCKTCQDCIEDQFLAFTTGSTGVRSAESVPQSTQNNTTSQTGSIAHLTVLVDTGLYIQTHTFEWTSDLASLSPEFKEHTQHLEFLKSIIQWSDPLFENSTDLENDLLKKVNEFETNDENFTKNQTKARQTEKSQEDHDEESADEISDQESAGRTNPRFRSKGPQTFYQRNQDEMGDQESAGRTNPRFRSKGPQTFYQRHQDEIGDQESADRANARFRSKGSQTFYQRNQEVLDGLWLFIRIVVIPAAIAALIIFTGGIPAMVAAMGSIGAFAVMTIASSLGFNGLYELSAEIYNCPERTRPVANKSQVSESENQNSQPHDKQQLGYAGQSIPQPPYSNLTVNTQRNDVSLPSFSKPVENTSNSPSLINEESVDDEEPIARVAEVGTLSKNNSLDNSQDNSPLPPAAPGRSSPLPALSVTPRSASASAATQPSSPPAAPPVTMAISSLYNNRGSKTRQPQAINAQVLRSSQKSDLAPSPIPSPRSPNG